MLAAENWCIKVAEKTYGPYSTPQMRKFAHEGRLASTSLISPAGSRAWREAREENTFATFFGFSRKDGAKAGNRTFGKRDDTTPAQPANDAAAGPRHKPQARKAASKPDIRLANFVVIFDVVNAAATRVEAAIFSLGQAFRLADNVWSVSCELTAVGVRNAIAPYLNSRESVFVVDATRGRSSWQNYSPEAQSKITAAYVTPKS